MKKQNLKNYLKLGIMLIGISFIPINCQTDLSESFSETKPINVKTVSFEDAKSFFKNNLKANQFAKSQNGKNENEIILNPDWTR